MSTQGTKIVDADQNEVKLSCTNWYGAHMERYVVNGLDKVHIDFVPAAMAGLGLNCVRLPFSLEQYYSNPVVKNQYLTANPEL